MAGNSLNEATKITIGRTSRLHGRLRNNDRVDFYQFSLNRASFLSVTLRNLAAKADLSLLDRNGNEIIVSDNPGQASEIITPPFSPLPGRLRPYFIQPTGEGNTTAVEETPLRAGTYFLRVRQIDGETNYMLTTTAIVDASIPPTNVPPQPVVGPNRLAQARAVTVDRQTRKFRGGVSRNRSEVLYRFAFERTTRFSAVLVGLDDNADMALLNAGGQVLRRSINPGDTSEVIIRDRLAQGGGRSLPAGVYYIRVYRTEGSTNFELRMTGVVDQGVTVPPGGGGSGGGTGQTVRDIRPGTPSSNPSALFTAGGFTYFSADNGINGRELWRTDGTSAGTQLVRDINPLGSSDPTEFEQVGNVIFFAASDGVTGTELWRTDGTSQGTTRVADINPGAASSNPSSLVNFNGVLYFAADGGIFGRELWRLDGQTPVQVTDINSLGSADPSQMVVFRDRLFFSANDVLGTELWSTDGTAAGTQRFRDINPGTASSNPTGLEVFNNQLYFGADDGVNGRELWRTDGTAVTLFSNIRTGADSSDPADFEVVGNTLFFAATSTNAGRELHSTNGTTVTLVRNINPDTADASPTDLTNVNNVLYFVAEDGINGRQIYRSNGTSAGTVRVTTTTLPNFNPDNLESIGSILLFSATTAATGTELFRINA